MFFRNRLSHIAYINSKRQNETPATYGKLMWSLAYVDNSAVVLKIPPWKLSKYGDIPYNYVKIIKAEIIFRFSYT